MLHRSTLLIAALLFAAQLASSVTLPKRTKLVVRTESWLNSGRVHEGDSFDATLTQDILVDGKVAVPKGTAVQGSVLFDSPGSQAVLKLQLDSIEFNGRHPIGTSIVSRYAPASPGDQMENRRTAADQMAGVIRDSTRGSTSGPGISVGGTAQRSSSGQVDVPPGTVLTFTLLAPVDISPSDDNDK